MTEVTAAADLCFFLGDGGADGGFDLLSGAVLLEILLDVLTFTKFSVFGLSFLIHICCLIFNPEKRKITFRNL